jgi:hypothetical protein
MTFDPIAELQKVFEEHELRSDRKGQSVTVAESDLAASAVLVSVDKYPNAVLAQLDMRVESKKLGERLLVESFAGLGPDESEALKHAFAQFLKASLHVLLATLVDSKHGNHQVEWDSWNVHGAAWRVCLGPILQHGSPRVTVEFSRLLDHIRDELPRLSDEPHWLRVFCARNGSNPVTAEVRLDNLYWSEGRRIADAGSWPDGNYRVRNFLMMTRVDGQHGK